MPKFRAGRSAAARQLVQGRLGGQVAPAELQPPALLQPVHGGQGVDEGLLGVEELRAVEGGQDGALGDLVPAELPEDSMIHPSTAALIR